MNNLFRSEDARQIQQRLRTLRPDAARRWGKMNASQMLAHCTLSLETAMGLNSPKRPPLPVRLIGAMLKKKYMGAQPFAKNSPTDRMYLIGETPDFETERSKVLARIEAFCAGGPERCNQGRHPFFGALTPEQWAIMQWKHFDHHLRQFGA